MSQLFTLQFPKYHFDQQNEFTIQFPNAKDLPFTYEVTNGIVCVDEILSPSEEEENDAHYMKQRRLWTRMGLQEGVRIISVHNKDITNDGKSKKVDILNSFSVDEIIKEHTNKENHIELTFREEILEFDDSVSLGLTYTESRETEFKSEPISNNQIGASSCSPNHDPFQCRLNNPNSCWKPSKEQKDLNNSWIIIDLKDIKMITKIRCQGTPNGNKSYIKSIWIDFSDDGTDWICHNSIDGDAYGEIECIYDKYKDNQFGAVDDEKNMDNFAEIDVWPPIIARFIRLRPAEYHNEIALRFDLYGPSENRLEFARVLKFGDLSQENRHFVLEKIKHINTDSRIIQVDCRAVLRKALDDANMSYVGFVETDKNNYLCVFSTADLTATERTIEELMNVGIGRAMGVAGICPMQFRRPAKQKSVKTEKDGKKRGGVTQDFYSSIKSRQIVDQLVDNTTQSAEFTYDYVSMLLVADVIAAMGLATNSAVIVVASMLVSPIMGPVLALTFGVHLRKFKFAKALARLGLKNEFWSLIICILVGFIVGFILIAITENQPQGNTPWPTEEMYGRGQVSGLATGAIVAFASGIGVALSVVGDYMATVIGVAISASLLPPAVNCGMLWAMSAYVYMWNGSGSNPGCNEKDCYDAAELALMGTISIVLTIENIILVFLASMMMFKIKDVTLSKERGFDDQNRQLVYQSITSFKDRYDDIKRASHFNLGPSTSWKSLSGKSILGKSLKNLTVDQEVKDRTLKKSLMSHNTMIRGSKNVDGRTGTLKRVSTEMDGIMEEEEEDDDLYTGSDDMNENKPLVEDTNVTKDTISGFVEITENED